MLQVVDKCLTFLGSNFRIIGLCSAITIIGFIITVFIFFRTRSIGKRIKEFKTKKKYNKKRIDIKTTLIQFRESIEEDDTDIKKIKTSILDELNVLSQCFHTEFNFIQNRQIKKLVTHLEKRDNHDRNDICNMLSRIISYLEDKKEELI